MPQLANIGALLAGLAAAALVIDVATITALDGSFGAPDTAMFLAGLVAAVLATALFAREATRRTAHPVGYAVLTFFVTVGLLVGVSLGADRLSDRFYDGGNAGLDNEWGIFSLGLMMFGLCGWFLSRAAKSTPLC